MAHRRFLAGLLTSLLWAPLIACGGGSAGAGAGDAASGAEGWQPPPDAQAQVAWVSGAWTQPVPSWGSPVRLSLPAPVEKILLGPTSAIGAFGAHQGGHPEGLDHVWIHIDDDEQVRSWAAGTVIDVRWMQTEYIIKIDYGQGLVGTHMEVESSLVVIGDKVAEGQPVALGLAWGGGRSAEFTLEDWNRIDGVYPYVSSFDYLKEEAKQALLARYVAEVVTPYFTQGIGWGDSKPWEPYLTNRLLLHKGHPGTILGEWLLSNRAWSMPGDGAPDIMTFMDAANPYGVFRRFATADDSGPQSGLEGTWTVDYDLKRFTLVAFGVTYYGIFELEEGGPRAKLKLEFQPGAYPAAFSASAAVYVERSRLPRRVDAKQLGVLP